MIDFDVINVGDKVIVCDGVVSYEYGYHRRKWSMPVMRIATVTDKKKTQFTVDSGRRFSRNGNEMGGSGSTAHMICETDRYHGGPLIEKIIDDDVIIQHKEKIKKISKAESITGHSSAFQLYDIPCIDDAVTVADAIIAAKALMDSLRENVGAQ